MYENTLSPPADRPPATALSVFYWESGSAIAGLLDVELLVMW